MLYLYIKEHLDTHVAYGLLSIDQIYLRYKQYHNVDSNHNRYNLKEYQTRIKFIIFIQHLTL